MNRPAAYYNEIDPYAAQWLRNLIAAGEIPAGDVDERPIEEVTADDVRPYTQCHFFAGIGGWAYAARLAGWPDDRPIWTGSCPCQDFSNAGRQAGFDGLRDLWPVWHRLIRECAPSIVAGEQVDDSIEWYERTASDLEATGYAVGAVVVPACAVGADHERARLWFVADDRSERIQGRLGTPLQGKRALPWGENGRGIEDVRERSGVSQPLLRRLGDGVSDGVDLLHGFGNAIVPQVAAQILIAWQEVSV